MKRFLTFLLSLIISVSSVTFTSSAVSEKDGILQFNEDGSFKILQISDIQDGALMRPMTKTFIKDLVDRVNPDLVVLTGDNIRPVSYILRFRKSFANFMDIFEEKGVKVAAVFGNHDGENIHSKDKQFAQYQKYSCFIGYEGEKEAALTGCGTYNIPIMSSKNADKKVFNLWFFDSQEYNEENDLEGYGCVQKDQIQWYIEKEAELTKENKGKPIPSLAFQHIIIPEVYEVLEKVDADKKEENFSFEKNGTTYLLPEEFRNEDTFLNETCCPPEYTNGQADALVENGKVLGIAVGHDHKNSFVIPYKTLDIIQTPTVGFGSYGDINRGARVITLNEDNLDEYETDVIFFKEYYDLNDPAIYNRYVLNSDEFSFGQRIGGLFKWGYYSIKGLFS